MGEIRSGEIWSQLCGLWVGFWFGVFVIIIMILTRSLGRLSGLLLQGCLLPFSSKKSSEQLAYFNHRVETLPGFTYAPIKPTISIADFLNKYSQSSSIDSCPIELVSGRISSIRKHGKTTFIDIREQHLRLQIAVKTGNEEGGWRRGDVVGAKGKAFVTKKGELSLLLEKPEDVWVVSPCLWMLPEYSSLKDNEVRYRNKHLDLITNPESLQMVKLRSKIISTLREELLARDYIQVETPTLSPSAGGAIAKPFVTYHNDHKMSLFMRIAPELFLKRLLIGGIPRVFQIGKNFRNESIDQTHNPEFTSCELYCAYSDYRQMAFLTKQLLCSIVQKSLGQDHCRVSFQGGEIDIAGEWLEIDFIGGLEERTGVTFPTEFQSEASVNFLKDLCIKHNVACDQPRTAERMLDKLAGHFLEPLSFERPLLLFNHPKILSPLAKPLSDRPHLTARFELFMRGWEFVNSYTELNDPRIQRENTPEDEEFCEALEYGLMPCAGWGLGVDRLVMLLGGCERIQDVIIFPLLKKEE